MGWIASGLDCEWVGLRVGWIASGLDCEWVGLRVGCNCDLIFTKLQVQLCVHWIFPLSYLVAVYK